MTTEEYGVGLIACDIDGCLNSGKNRTLQLSKLQVLAHHNRNRIETGLPPICLISGRPQPFVEAYANMISCLNYCVCENGAMIFHPATGEIQIDDRISPDKTRALRELEGLLEQEVLASIAAIIEPGKRHCVSISALAGGPKVAELVELVAPYVDTSLFEVSRSGSAVDITTKGVNKASGLLNLSRLEQLNPRNMIGVGNSAADADFLSLVGYSTVPANGSAEAKAVADHVSKASFIDGTIDGINHHLNAIAAEFDTRTVN